MADVFVSYARYDRPRVEPLVRLLESRGWSVWWDKALAPGDRFERLIDTEIQSARCVVAVWTEHSVDSDWVQAEAGDGLDRGILIPVMMDPVRIPIAFRRMDAATLLGWPKQRSKAEIERFLNAVERTIDGHHAELRAAHGTPSGQRPRTVRWLISAAAAAGIGAAIYVAVQNTVIDGARPDIADRAVTVLVRPFEAADEAVSGIEYELERRIAAAPGLAVRVSGDQSLLGDYQLSAAQRGQLLSVALVDRNGVRLLSRTVSLDTDLATLASGLARDILSRLGQPPAVAESFDEPVAPDVFRTFLKANSFLRSASAAALADARDLYASVVAAAPRFAGGHAGLCRANLYSYMEFRDDGFVDTAEHHCHRALTLNDRDGRVHAALGLLYKETGNYGRSVDSYRRALELAPYSTDAMRGLAATLSATGAFEDAEAALLEAIAVEPDYWENYHALGNTRYQAGRFERAMAAYRDALALAPDESRVLNNLGAASFMANDFERAVGFWRRAARLQPSAATYLNLGAAYFLLRDFDAAIDVYRQAQRLTPDDHFTSGHVGEAMLVSGNSAYGEQFDHAIALARRRLDIDPNDRWTRAALGAYHAALGQREQAIGFVEATTSLAPDDVDVVYNAAVAHARLGEPDQAALYLAALIDLGYPAEHLGRDANFDDVPDTWSRASGGRRP